jgi:hypothetical protein
MRQQQLQGCQFFRRKMDDGLSAKKRTIRLQPESAKTDSRTLETEKRRKRHYDPAQSASSRYWPFCTPEIASQKE